MSSREPMRRLVRAAGVTAARAGASSAEALDVAVDMIAFETLIRLRTLVLAAAARLDAERAAARAIAASADANGVSQEAVVREATELLRNLDGEIGRT